MNKFLFSYIKYKESKLNLFLNQIFKMIKYLVFAVMIFGIRYGFGQKYEQKFDRRVFDGEKLDPTRNKHLIYLEISYADYKTNRSIEVSFCSGSIISDNWILTAAHCFFNKLVKKQTKNNSEEYSTNATVFHKKNGQFERIAKVAEVYLRDPNFLLEHQSTESIENDLALLKTQKRINFNNFIQTIPLATRSIKVGDWATISGYGEVGKDIFGSSQGSVEMKSCRFTRGTTLLCSKDVVKAGAGDSGGSLVFKGKLVGVTSKSCSDEYISKPCRTIFVDVPVNLDWIMRVTGIDKRF